MFAFLNFPLKMFFLFIYFKKKKTKCRLGILMTHQDSPKNCVTSKHRLMIQHKQGNGKELCTKEHASKILAFNGCLSVHYGSSGSSYTHINPL